MTVGLFGGSFNPPHLGHLVVAETMREQFGLDVVWWIPAPHPPHKPDAGLAAPRHRLEMTRRAVAGNPGFAVSEIEIERAGPSYTIDTIRALQADHLDHQFSLMLGGDTLNDFPTWRAPEEIAARVPLLVYHRPGAVMAAPAAGLETEVRFAVAPLIDISGTDIRARVHAGHSIRYLVPDAVRAYIAEHGLYRATPA